MSRIEFKAVNGLRREIVKAVSLEHRDFKITALKYGANEISSCPILTAASV